jgi:hypothetical protein
MMIRILVIVIHCIINMIKLNSFYFGIMRISISIPSENSYDFTNNTEIINYSKVNLTNYIIKKIK